MKLLCFLKHKSKIQRCKLSLKQGRQQSSYQERAYYIAIIYQTTESISINIKKMYCEDEIQTMNISLNIANQADGSNHSYPCLVPLIAASRQLRLNEALDDTCHRVMPLYGAQIFCVDFANRMNRFLGIYPFDREIRVGSDTLVNRSLQIIVKPGRRNQMEMKQVKEQQGVENQAKAKKVKQRTIQEAVESVKLWRVLYDTDDGKGKRLYTLDEAAQKVGVAKKTLDDYHSLIRTAMNYGFDLEKFKQCKVGLLRRFVKIAKQQGQQGVNTSMGEYLVDQNLDKYWIDFNEL